MKNTIQTPQSSTNAEPKASPEAPMTQERSKPSESRPVASPAKSTSFFDPWDRLFEESRNSRTDKFDF